MNDPIELLRQKHLKENTPHGAAYHEMLMLARKYWGIAKHYDGNAESISSLKMAIKGRDQEMEQHEKEIDELKSRIKELEVAIAPNSPLENLRIATAIEKCRRSEKKIKEVIKFGKRVAEETKSLEGLLKDLNTPPKPKDADLDR